MQRTVESISPLGPDTAKLDRLPNKTGFQKLIDPLCQSEKGNSHRIACMVVLLIVAVALTTVLVIAAERTTASKKDSSNRQSALTQTSEVAIGAWRWT